jgi:hypothetical protein
VFKKIGAQSLALISIMEQTIYISPIKKIKPKLYFVKPLVLRFLRDQTIENIQEEVKLLFEAHKISFDLI